MTRAKHSRKAASANSTPAISVVRIPNDMEACILGLSGLMKLDVTAARKSEGFLRPSIILRHTLFGGCWSVVNASRHIDEHMPRWSIVVPYFVSMHILCTRRDEVHLVLGNAYVFDAHKQHWTRNGRDLLIFETYDCQHSPNKETFEDVWATLRRRFDLPLPTNPETAGPQGE